MMDLVERSWKRPTPARPEEDVFLYHYYEADIGAFVSLSDLPIDEAERILDRIRDEGVVFASRQNREYMTIRRQLEQKARNMFIEKGGKPQRAVPHYMTLGECSWFRNWYRECREIKIPLRDFCPEIISFTYGDLFPTMRFADGKPYRNKIYRFHEIFDLIDQYGLPQDWNGDGKLGPERYIEAQVWDDKPVGKFIGMKRVYAIGRRGAFSNMDRQLIGRCGSYCGACAWREKMNCPGCQPARSKVFWGECAVAKCSLEKGLEHCGSCPQIACATLQGFFDHPEHGDSGERLANLKNWANGSEGYLEIRPKK